MTVGVGALSCGEKSLRDERLGLRFKDRGGECFGVSGGDGGAQFAWRDEVLGGVGGRTSFFLPAGRVLILADCCGDEGRVDCLGSVMADADDEAREMDMNEDVVGPLYTNLTHRVEMPNSLLLLLLRTHNRRPGLALFRSGCCRVSRTLTISHAAAGQPPLRLNMPLPSKSYGPVASSLRVCNVWGTLPDSDRNRTMESMSCSR